MNFHNNQFCSDIANLVNRELKARGLKVKDLARISAGPLGLAPSTLETYIHEVRGGWVFYTDERTNSMRIRQSEKLAAVLFCLRVSDKHPIISDLKNQDSSFEYPPANSHLYEIA